MLSIYGKKLRPQNEVNAIISATSGFEEKTLKKWQKISTSDSQYIHIIVSGDVEFRRESDELCMFTVQGPCIFWALFYVLQRHAHVWPHSVKYRRALDKKRGLRPAND